MNGTMWKDWKYYTILYKIHYCIFINNIYMMNYTIPMIWIRKKFMQCILVVCFAINQISPQTISTYT